LCIDALFGEQRLFFNQLRLVQAGLTPGDPSSSDVGRNKDGNALVHKEIFLRELQTSGRDVMLHLNDRFPLTHEWILKNALAWSRYKIAKLVPKSPERESTLRAAARERRSEEVAVRDRQRRALSAIGGEPTQVIAPSNNGEAPEHAFHELADRLSTLRDSRNL
jgi:hypothetical protein